MTRVRKENNEGNIKYVPIESVFGPGRRKSVGLVRGDVYVTARGKRVICCMAHNFANEADPPVEMGITRQSLVVGDIYTCPERGCTSVVSVRKMS